MADDHKSLAKRLTEAADAWELGFAVVGDERTMPGPALLREAASVIELQACDVAKAGEQAADLAVKYSRQVDQYVALTEELRRWRAVGAKAQSAILWSRCGEQVEWLEQQALEEIRLLLPANESKNTRTPA